MHIIAWSPPLCWGLVILILSGDLGSSRNTLGLVSWLLSHFSDLLPEHIAALHGFLRIGGHMLAYGALFFLWFRAFEVYWPGRRWPLLALALLCSLMVGMLDEGHQSLVGSRRGSAYHIGWDLAGASLSAMLILACRKPRAQVVKGSG
jgi:VanZ family protein